MQDFDEGYDHLRPLNRDEDPALFDYFDVMSEFSKENVRGIAIVSCSFIDVLLERAIKSFLLPCSSTNDLITGFNAPLGTFSAKIKMARALGIITQDEARFSDELRKARNIFSHTPKVDLNSEDIKKIIGKLSECAFMKAGQRDTDPHTVIYLASNNLIISFLHRAEHVAKICLKERTDPWDRGRP